MPERGGHRRRRASPPITASGITRDSRFHSVRRRHGRGGTTSAVLDRLGLEHRRYFLYVSRMEPENNALLVREAFEQLRDALKLALIGDAPYARTYIGRVRAHPRSARRDARSDLRRRLSGAAVRIASPTSMPPRSAARIRR